MSIAVVCGLQLGWVTPIAGMVESWLCAAGRSTRVAGIVRIMEIQLDVWVVGCSWTVVAGSWGRSSCWMQLDDRSRKLRSVESLDASRYSESSWLVVAMLGQSITASCYADWMLHCWSIVVCRSISRFWRYIGLTRGVSIWLLARNSKSLRGLDAALLG